MRLLLKNARLLTMENDQVTFGEILVDGHFIAYVGPSKKHDEKIDKVIDCEGNLLMPGFKNAHAHTAMVFARSLADDSNLHDWLFDHIFPLEEKFQDGDIYTLTRGGILEYLSGGITAAFDMYFKPPEIIKASEELGFRNVILATSTEEPISLLKERYLSLNKEDSLISYSLGIHAEYTTSEERIKDIIKLAHELKAPIYLHIGETESEVQGCVKRHGYTPLKYLDTLGFFDNGGAGFHCNYLSDEEISICQKKNISIVSCPASNLKLASGIAPLCKYQKAGLRIGLGTDGAASNNSLDMFKEMFLASALQKVTTKDPTALSGYSVLKMATVDSAHIMGLDNCDILKEGKFADIIMIDLQNPAMQPINNIINNLVYAGSKDIVKMTMINGQILYCNQEYYLPISKDEILGEVQRVTNRLKS